MIYKYHSEMPITYYTILEGNRKFELYNDFIMCSVSFIINLKIKLRASSITKQLKSL